MNPLKILFVLFAFLELASCKKSTPTPSKNKKTDVYVIGSEVTSNYYVPVGVYWKNGVKVVLSDTTVMGLGSKANAITVNDTDVYIAGSINYHAVYWKNGKVASLPGGAGSEAGAITVVGTDVYVAGYSDITGNIEPTYWKNGAPVILDDGGVGANINATAIAVSGNNVYVAGYSLLYKVNKSDPNAYPNAVFWNNGVLSVLGPSVSTASSITPPGIANEGWINMAVSGTDVYITGALPTLSSISYWKNGVLVPLPTDPKFHYSFLNNIMIVGGDVYAAGLANFSPAYWKNGVITTLPGDLSHPATGIAVSGNDVYVSGNTINGPVYWKNDRLIQLGKYPLLAYGIAVVSH